MIKKGLKNNVYIVTYLVWFYHIFHRYGLSNKSLNSIVQVGVVNCFFYFLNHFYELRLKAWLDINNIDFFPLQNKIIIENYLLYL